MHLLCSIFYTLRSSANGNFLSSFFAFLFLCFCAWLSFFRKPPARPLSLKAASRSLSRLCITFFSSYSFRIKVAAEKNPLPMIFEPLYKNLGNRNKSNIHRSFHVHAIWHFGFCSCLYVPERLHTRNGQIWKFSLLFSLLSLCGPHNLQLSKVLRSSELPHKHSAH